MALFLSPYSGTGTKADPFKPAGYGVPGMSAIDIRLDPTRADGNGVGFALVWMPIGETDPVRAIKIADDYGDLLTNQQRTRLNQRTGLDFGADTTIQDVIETIMLRADTLGWKRLRPAKGVYEVWLGSGSGKRDWIGLPAIAGGSLSDSFNRADETPIASPWTKLTGSTGNVNLSSNAVVKSGVGDYYAYYSNASGWNADQTSEIRSGSAATTFCDAGVAVRVGSSGLSGYFITIYSGGLSVVKHVTGTYSWIESFASNNVANSTLYKISAVGSTIRYYAAGVEDANSPATDTSLSTAGNGAGFFMYDGPVVSQGMDDWTGTGEITAGKAFPFPPCFPMALLAR